MKKLYALLMSCALVFSGSYITALAENETEPQTEEPEEVIEEVAEAAEEVVTAEEAVAEEAPAADAEPEETAVIEEEPEEPEAVEQASAESFTIHFKCGSPYQRVKDEQFDIVVEPGKKQYFPENDGRFETIASRDGITFWYDPNGGTMPAGDGDVPELIEKGYSGFKTPCTFSYWWIRSIDKRFAPGDEIPADLAKPGETIEAEACFHSAVTMPEASRPGYTLLGWSDGWYTYNPKQTYHLDMSFLHTAQWVGFEQKDGKSYWYETVFDKETGKFENVKQGTVDDPKGVIGDGTNRGREIYDPLSNQWYWLDSCLDGAKAIGKEVWVPYVYQDEDSWTAEEKAQLASESDEGMADLVLTEMNKKHGKWVRYDENGAMLKGWITIDGELAKHYPEQAGKTYYYDNRTGIMARGTITIGGVTHHFDEITGELLDN